MIDKGHSNRANSLVEKTTVLDPDWFREGGWGSPSLVLAALQLNKSTLLYDTSPGATWPLCQCVQYFPYSHLFETPQSNFFHLRSAQGLRPASIPPCRQASSRQASLGNTLGDTVCQAPNWGLFHSLPGTLQTCTQSGINGGRSRRWRRTDLRAVRVALTRPRRLHQPAAHQWSRRTCDNEISSRHRVPA